MRDGVRRLVPTAVPDRGPERRGAGGQVEGVPGGLPGAGDPGLPQLPDVHRAQLAGGERQRHGALDAGEHVRATDHQEDPERVHCVAGAQAGRHRRLQRALPGMGPPHRLG